jgi:glutamine synthetase
MNPIRLQIQNTLSTRAPVINELAAQKISEIFASRTFSLREMQARLPKDIFEQVKKVVVDGEPLDSKVGKAVAEAAKNWALHHGVTHFTHWFQPMTGLTAEKHDSFVSFEKDGSLIEKFSAGQLLQSEPDASSFPSGGMRATFEARGYTAWDATSPLFIIEHAATKVLCIPSVFVSYTGHSLDTKTGLLKSIDSLNLAATQMLQELGDKNIKNVTATVGVEQEYFLIDKAFYHARPDLLLTGRSLIGGDMPKGQQLEDHYFGSIPPRAQAFMADAEFELYRLGIPVKTRHNEVAPSQFETAPIFEEANLAADHNMLTMEVLKRTAEKHGFACLLHEKPFAGINGSGKHCNWSIATDSGENLLEPGHTPHTNFRFIAVLSCVLKAVFENQIALRAAIASHGNDHRLGANEAPPAIISAFLGSTLTQILDGIASGKDLSTMSAEKAMIQFGMNRLPSIPKDNTDRNRTSPFAFTGNKFEFRAVGSSHAVSFPITVLNAAVAKTMNEFTAKLKIAKSNASSADSAALEVSKQFIIESKNIRFEGDGYSDDWKIEARKRGLSEILKTPDSLVAFGKTESHGFLIESGTFKKEEIDALIDIRLERYIKHLHIEASTLLTLAKQFAVPAGAKYLNEIATGLKAFEGVGGSSKNLKWLASEVSSLIEETFDCTNRLQDELKIALEKKSHSEMARYFGDKVATTMGDLRNACDKLEAIVSDEHWPLPKYREMLFLR